jgi:hypothetical protein
MLGFILEIVMLIVEFLIVCKGPWRLVGSLKFSS